MNKNRLWRKGPVAWAGLGLVALMALVAFGTAWAATINESAKLTASDGAAGDFFGLSVAVSGDAIAIGAPYDDDKGANSGSAYVFGFDGTTWTEQAKLTASDGAAGDYFGASVAVSGDTIVVGAFWDDVGRGAAYVFSFDDATWNETKLTASDAAAYRYFGYSVAASGDTIVVGDLFGGHPGGSAYVFSFDGTDWIEEAKLTASDGAADDRFGHSVAVSGETIVVGAWGDDLSRGSAYVFGFDGTNWTEEAKLTAGDGAYGDHFGRSVAVSGETIVVGAYVDDSYRGSAYVFGFDGTRWTEEAKLTASDGVNSDQFGTSVAVSGETIVVGAIGDDDNGWSSGSAYVFNFDGTNWTETDKLTSSDGAADDFFGSFVAISGATSVIGVSYDDDNGSFSGSAYVFRLTKPPTCAAAQGSLGSLWPPNHAFVDIHIEGVTDPEADPITITIDDIFQDEIVPFLHEDGTSTEPDGKGVGTDTASLRAERNEDGNGRVYHINFTASDDQGGTCTGEVLVGVPRNQGDGAPIDEGALYYSYLVISELQGEPGEACSTVCAGARLTCDAAASDASTFPGCPTGFNMYKGGPWFACLDRNWGCNNWSTFGEMNCVCRSY